MQSFTQAFQRRSMVVPFFPISDSEMRLIICSLPGFQLDTEVTVSASASR
jgi:hypothetical protein